MGFSTIANIGHSFQSEQFAWDEREIPPPPGAHPVQQLNRPDTETEVARIVDLD
jgi:hypothetical protein